MRLLRRYLARAVVLGTLLALLVLVSVDTLIDFLNELEDVGKGGYTFLQATLYTLLSIPQSIYEFYPTCVLVGSLLSLGNLAANSELVAMRAAGLSKPRIIRSVLATGLVMAIGIILLGEFVAPGSAARAERLQDNPGGAGRISLKTRYGLWAKDGDRFINVRAVYPGHRLAHIWIYRIRDLQLVEATFAQSADYRDGYWYLRDLRRSLISRAGVQVQTSRQERWRRLISPELLDVITVDPEEMSARELAQYITYLNGNHLDPARYQLAFWTRFSTPLSSLVMLLLAIPFAFGSARSGGAGQRLFIGIAIGLAFHLFNGAVNHLSLVYGLPPLLGAFLPMGVALVIGLVAIRRMG